ncbi:DinB family protein [Danxiaibacter flavus]|uniref:DinB family protein n=1 Tax=Danxiaibacter flavus TaxID=3049108 RepID=A0ABV3ZAB3_9BACT|nr:DinB family protein [Chitinophagaceae bacterium DXS]
MQCLTKLINDFNNTIDAWIAELGTFDFEKLITKPDAESWSLGQVYMHLINETDYYIEQIEASTNNNANLSQEMTDIGKSMFRSNAFPEVKIKGDPASTDKIQQPQSKTGLHDDMLALKQRMNRAAQSLVNTTATGKTQHPGLGYFSGPEWLQFADMHLRHHLRQKERIKNFLANQH